MGKGLKRMGPLGRDAAAVDMMKIREVEQFRIRGEEGFGVSVELRWFAAGLGNLRWRPGGLHL